MISVYNLVTRRPHVPREIGLRRILISQGFDIPLESPPRPGPTPAADHPNEDDGDDGFGDGDSQWGWEEHPESEVGTDDEFINVFDDPKGNSTAYLIG